MIDAQSEVRRYYDSEGQMVAARELRHLGVKASDWCQVNSVEGRRSQMSWAVMPWPGEWEEGDRVSLHVDVLLPDELIMRVPAGFARASAAVRQEELIGFVVRAHRELCFVDEPMLADLEEFLRADYGRYARLQEFGGRAGPRFRITAEVPLDGLCHVSVDGLVGADWHRIEPELLQAAQPSLMRQGMKEARVRGDSLVLESPWAEVTFSLKDAQPQPTPTLSRATAVPMVRSGPDTVIGSVVARAAREGHPAYVEHFTAEFYDDEANELAPFGSDEGWDLWVDWRSRADEVGGDGTVRAILASECGGPEHVDGFLAWAEDSDSTDAATIALVVAFVLLRLTGRIDPEGKMVALRAVDTLIGAYGPAEELTTIRDDLLRWSG